MSDGVRYRGLPKPSMGHLPKCRCGGWYTDPEETVMVCRDCGARREYRDGYWIQVSS